MVTRGFESDARFNARREGVDNLALAVVPLSAVPLPKEIEELDLGQQTADEIVRSLTRTAPSSATKDEAIEEELLSFNGSSWTDAWESMERFFLERCWSDGFPLVPPTREAVDRMLEGTHLHHSHVVGLVEPAGTEATVEKIAINAVLAGCLPQHMPVIIAAVEAITDPLFDLQGVQCTTGPVSPFMIISGRKLIDQLNINDSYSTAGPGWQANTTIGRAIRLIMINLGLAWPGKSDMKAIGSPFRFVMLIAENEAAYGGSWAPIRVAEGFENDDATISVMPAVSWQPRIVSEQLATPEYIIEAIAEQGIVKFSSTAATWGTDDLVLINPAAFEPIRKGRLSRSDVQQALYKAVKTSGRKIFGGQQLSKGAIITRMPESLVQQFRQDADALLPLLPAPESMKIVVAGGPGTHLVVYVAGWGFGPAHFVTKKINPPKNWENLLAKYGGGKTPVVK